jgi:hypothetical protein
MWTTGQAGQQEGSLEKFVLTRDFERRCCFNACSAAASEGLARQPASSNFLVDYGEAASNA